MAERKRGKTKRGTKGKNRAKDGGVRKMRNSKERKQCNRYKRMRRKMTNNEADGTGYEEIWVTTTKPSGL